MKRFEDVQQIPVINKATESSETTRTTATLNVSSGAGRTIGCPFEPEETTDGDC